MDSQLIKFLSDASKNITSEKDNERFEWWVICTICDALGEEKTIRIINEKCHFTINSVNELCKNKNDISLVFLGILTGISSLENKEVWKKLSSRSSELLSKFPDLKTKRINVGNFAEL